MNIRTANYKDRIESKWLCLRKRAIEDKKEKARYNKALKKLKRRVDRINQSVLTEEKIKLEEAKIRYKEKEEEIKRMK